MCHVAQAKMYYKKGQISLCSPKIKQWAILSTVPIDKNQTEDFILTKANMATRLARSKSGNQGYLSLQTFFVKDCLNGTSNSTQSVARIVCEVWRLALWSTYTILKKKSLFFFKSYIWEAAKLLLQIFLHGIWHMPWWFCFLWQNRYTISRTLVRLPRQPNWLYLYIKQKCHNGKKISIFVNNINQFPFSIFTGTFVIHCWHSHSGYLDLSLPFWWWYLISDMSSLQEFYQKNLFALLQRKHTYLDDHDLSKCFSIFNMYHYCLYYNKLENGKYWYRVLMVDWMLVPITIPPIRITPQENTTKHQNVPQTIEKRP